MGQAVGKERMESVGDQEQSGTYKPSLEPYEDGLKLVSTLVVFDLDGMDVLQKPGPLNMELSTHTWPRSLRT